MINIEQEATFRYSDVYKSIIAEAELHNLQGSDLQLFINATLRNVLLDQIKLTLIAQSRLRRTDKDGLKTRDEEILRLLLKGKNQKELARQNNLTGAAISKSVKRLVKEILGLNGETKKHSAGNLIKIYRKELNNYYTSKRG